MLNGKTIFILFVCLLSASVHSDDLKQPLSTPSITKDLSTKHVRSRYGNPAHYQVRGKRYDVNVSSKGYSQEGLASWYGDDFHEERTSSGEPYDMYAMTAAHKTLPLPTYVKVTNIENNRQVLVKVNDRGPFHEGRIIDLSFAAAKALDLDKKGVGKVRVEALESKAPRPRWYMQVAAFTKELFAKKFAKKLSSYVSLPISIIKERGINLVQVGPMKDRAQSIDIENRLFSLGIEDVFTFIK